MKAFILNAIIMAIAARFFYTQGLKDANFDRNHANYRLQQCLEVLRQ